MAIQCRQSLPLFYLNLVLVLVFSLLFPPLVGALESSAIQQLVDNLPSSGGTITLPVGEHVLSTANGSLEYFPNGNPIPTAILINKNHVIFQGEGHGTILKLAPHTKMRVISISSSHVTIKNLVIDGNKTQRNGTVPYPGGDVVDGLLYGNQTASNLVFENLEIKNGIEDAMGSWLGENIVGRNNYIHDNGTPQAGAAGFSLSGVTLGQAYANRIENNTATGIWSSFNANGIKIFNNTLRNNASGGITIGGGTISDGLGPNNTGFEIQNNILSGNGSTGFATITIFASKNGSVVNNTIETSAYDNIQIGGTGAIHAVNWKIMGNTCTGPIGIRNLGNADAIILQSNTCQTNFTQNTTPGDLNADGEVNIFDYNLLLAEFGTKYTIFDYNAIVANYGK